MTRQVDIQFGEEPAVEIQPVTPLKAVPADGWRGNFWVGWQLFAADR